MLGNPVPHGALREACVGLLLACGSVGDLGPIDHSSRHTVAWQWTLFSSSVAIAPSTGLHCLRPHLVVVLVQGLAHVGHRGVGDLHRVAVDHLPQLVVEEGQDLLSSKCLPKEIFHHMNCILSDPGSDCLSLTNCETSLKLN